MTPLFETNSARSCKLHVYQKHLRMMHSVTLRCCTYFSWKYPFFQCNSWCSKVPIYP